MTIVSGDCYQIGIVRLTRCVRVEDLSFYETSTLLFNVLANGFYFTVHLNHSIGINNRTTRLCNKRHNFMQLSGCEQPDKCSYWPENASDCCDYGNDSGLSCNRSQTTS